MSLSNADLGSASRGKALGSYHSHRHPAEKQCSTWSVCTDPAGWYGSFHIPSLPPDGIGMPCWRRRCVLRVNRSVGLRALKGTLPVQTAEAATPPYGAAVSTSDLLFCQAPPPSSSGVCGSLIFWEHPVCVLNALRRTLFRLRPSDLSCPLISDWSIDGGGGVGGGCTQEGKELKQAAQ